MSLNQKAVSAGQSSLAKFDVVSTSVAPNKNWQENADNMGSESGCGHRKTEKKNKTTPALERKAQKRTHGNEQVRNGPKQSKDKTSTQVGKSHGKGRHRGIKGTQQMVSMVESRTNKTQIKTARSTSQEILMLELGSTDYSNQKIQRRKIKQHKRQYTLALHSTEQRKWKENEQEFGKTTTAAAAAV